MSFHAMSWAAKAKTQTPTQKLILLLLADRAGDNGICWPSIDRIAEDACVSDRCVIENVKKLAALGFIYVHKNAVAEKELGIIKKGGRHNVYVVRVGEYPLGKCGVNIDQVNEVHDIGERGSCDMVNHIHPNLSIEPIKEPITSSAIASAEELFNQSKKDPVRTGKDVARRDEFSYTEDFTAFWTAYPRHVGKGKAFAEWKRIKGRPPVEEIIQAVRKQQRSEQWTKDGGQFIPHPSTWLHQRRWEDEVDVRKSEKPYGYE